MRRIAALLLAVPLAAAPLLAEAQAWPARPVKFVVPFGAGGPADIYARFLGQRLQEPLGQSFVVENRPGGGSVIGTESTAYGSAGGTGAKPYLVGCLAIIAAAISFGT